MFNFASIFFFTPSRIVTYSYWSSFLNYLRFSSRRLNHSVMFLLFWWCVLPIHLQNFFHENWIQDLFFFSLLLFTSFIHYDFWIMFLYAKMFELPSLPFSLLCPSISSWAFPIPSACFCLLSIKLSSFIMLLILFLDFWSNLFSVDDRHKYCVDSACRWDPYFFTSKLCLKPKSHSSIFSNHILCHNNAKSNEIDFLFDLLTNKSRYLVFSIVHIS